MKQKSTNCTQKIISVSVHNGKATHEFYVRIYFIDQNDVFEMQNKINILVEKGHSLESQF